MTFFYIISGALHLTTIIALCYLHRKFRKEFNAYIRLNNDDLRTAIVNMVVKGGGIDSLRIAIEEKERRKEEKGSGSMAAVIKDRQSWTKETLNRR